MEEALGVDIGDGIRTLRRLMYCGEWVESHVLHAYLLHASDFLGMEDALQIARVHPELVERGLQLKKLGNRIIEVIGGRAIHPVNTRVGGLYKLPRREEVRGLIEPLKRAVDDSLATVTLFAGLEFPDFEHDYTFVALHHDENYAIERGRLVSNRGLDIPVSAFEEHFDEEHVRHRTALHGVMSDGSGPYMVGPLARYALNHAQLSVLAKQAAYDAGLGTVVRNPFKSIVVRAVETLYACEEALKQAEAYEGLAVPAPPAPPAPGAGTAAPRRHAACAGTATLRPGRGGAHHARAHRPAHRAEPEADRAGLWGVVQGNLHLPDEQLTWRCEQAIRNYDPRISCATHFLRLTVERE